MLGTTIITIIMVVKDGARGSLSGRRLPRWPLDDGMRFRRGESPKAIG
jgi:hypothetical protein